MDAVITHHEARQALDRINPDTLTFNEHELVLSKYIEQQRLLSERLTAWEEAAKK